jgi:stage V sporulation protein SpoVS
MANFIVVWASTDPSRLAEWIAVFIRLGESVVLLALGTGSVHVAVTAIGVARFQLVPDHRDLAFVTELCDLDEDGNERSALRVYAALPSRRFRGLLDLPIAS